MDPIEVDLHNNITMYNMPPPGSGILVAFILNILDAYKLNPSSITEDQAVLTYHRIVEAMKFAYARRTLLGDPAYINITQVSLILYLEMLSQ